VAIDPLDEYQWLLNVSLSLPLLVCFYSSNSFKNLLSSFFFVQKNKNKKNKNKNK